MRILITGAGGFAGHHLGALLGSEDKAELFGVYRSRRPSGEFPGSAVALDLERFDDIVPLIADIKPDEVYHLAGLSSPRQCKDDTRAAYRANTMATLNLLEALAREAPGARTLVVSSSEVYGDVDPAENPIGENRRPEPKSAYATSKRCAELVARQYAASSGMCVVVARAFNHTGPGQDERFVAPAFAMQAARIEAGAEPVIVTGGLETERDFCDVRDTVAAYRLLVRHGAAGGVYNVCSGRPVAVQWILDTLLELAGLDNVERKTDPSRSAPSKNRVIFGDGGALEKATGWRPGIPLRTTLGDLLDDCRARVAAEKTQVDYL